MANWVNLKSTESHRLRMMVWWKGYLKRNCAYTLSEIAGQAPGSNMHRASQVKGLGPERTVVWPTALEATEPSGYKCKPSSFGFKSQFQAVRSWTNQLISLCLNFLICEWPQQQCLVHRVAVRIKCFVAVVQLLTHV